MNFKINLSNTYLLTINTLLILSSFIMSYLLMKRKNEVPKNKNTGLEFYEKGYLYKGPNFIYNTIIAMIVKACGKGNLEIEKNFYKNKKGEEKVEFKLKNVNFPALDAAEKKLFDILLSFGEGEVSTRTLDKIRRKEPDNYNRKFNDFLHFLEDEMVAKKLLTREKKTFKILLSFVTFSLLFFLGIITVYNENFFGIASIILSLFFYATLIISFSKMTESGNKKFRELEKVEKELLNSNGDTEEDFLLALCFGLKKENIKTIYENFIKKTNTKDYCQIFFDPDFYKTFKTALVGDHLLVRNK